MRILSAHRTPDETAAWAKGAEARGLEVIIAAAGGAAHLPGVVAAQTVLPVLGIPVDATPLNGLDALLSIVQMPKGVPVGTLAIGKPGAANAALLATAILALKRSELRERLRVVARGESGGGAGGGAGLGRAGVRGQVSGFRGGTSNCELRPAVPFTVVMPPPEP